MRVVGQLLEFLSSDDSKDVFTIMTSNDVTQLPPELTRSGRLDTIWYFGLPNVDERAEIFKIHFSKTKLEVNKDIIDHCAEITDDFTGAEIKEMVKIIVRKVFNDYLKTNEINVSKFIEEAKNEIIPVSISSKEKIVALENYAKFRARQASANISQDSENVLSVSSFSDFE